MIEAFVLSNVLIALAYLFTAIMVVPIIPLSIRSQLLFALFLVSCSGTHIEHVLHALYDPGVTIRHTVTETHMIVLHVAQSFFAWGFALSFFYDLNKVRSESKGD